MSVVFVYADDSSDQKQQEIISAAGFWGWPANFWPIEKRWFERLTKDGIDYFHATECESLTGQFDPERLGMSLNAARALATSLRHDLIKILDSSLLDGYAVSLWRSDFSSVMQSNAKARELYPSDPAILTYRSFIRGALEAMVHLHPHFRDEVKVNFVFDNHSNFG